MPETHLCIELAVDASDDAIAIERAATNEGRRAARELYRRALADVDRYAVEVSSGARQRVEERWMCTLMGRVRVGRYRVRNGSRTHHPLDDMLNLHSGEASPAIRSLVQRLATRWSSREIAEVLNEISGSALSRSAVLRILDEDG